MTDSLFEAVALCSKELMKYSLSAEEFAVLAQKNGMTDSEILAVSKTFEYLRDKKKRESVEFCTLRPQESCLYWQAGNGKDPLGPGFWPGLL